MRALDTVLLGALDVVVVDVNANNRQVLRYHLRSVHAERKSSSDADVENLKRPRGAGTVTFELNCNVEPQVVVKRTLEPRDTCFKTTPYHLPVKRSDTRVSYLMSLLQ